jgi:hypothetical protein
MRKSETKILRPHKQLSLGAGFWQTERLHVSPYSEEVSSDD